MGVPFWGVRVWGKGKYIPPPPQKKMTNNKDYPGVELSIVENLSGLCGSILSLPQVIKNTRKCKHTKNVMKSMIHLHLPYSPTWAIGCLGCCAGVI
jgi:hypothetical protein